MPRRSAAEGALLVGFEESGGESEGEGESDRKVEGDAKDSTDSGAAAADSAGVKDAAAVDTAGAPAASWGGRLQSTQLSKYGGTSMMDAMQDVRTGQKSTAEVLDKSVRTNENLVRLEPGGYFIIR